MRSIATGVEATHNNAHPRARRPLTSTTLAARAIHIPCKGDESTLRNPPSQTRARESQSAEDQPMTVELCYLNSLEPDFWTQLDARTAWSAELDREIVAVVHSILDDVRTRGDTAVLGYTQQFDGLDPADPRALELPPNRLHEALNRLSQQRREALEFAAERIRSYAERQRMASWEYEDNRGTVLGQRITPLDRVGLYVPGGKAAYPSSVLMNAIPARVAGVSEILMTVPAPGGELSDLVLAAAAVAGVDRVFTIGGAQAIAALAFGTSTVPAVDKIVGPGNAYVATAKRLVYGTVGIDMVAGPSEVVIIADDTNDPEWIAMDLFAQAEHDEEAQATLITPDRQLLGDVADVITERLDRMSRHAIIRQSLEQRGAMIQVSDLDEAARVANYLAPEHLELAVADPKGLAARIRHAGALFLGRYSAEALGDYCAGPNHVLPTGRNARFASPLGVYDFQKRTSLLDCSANGAAFLAEPAGTLADGEGLTAHARSARLRGSSETRGD